MSKPGLRSFVAFVFEAITLKGMVRKVYTPTTSFHVFKVGETWYTFSGIKTRMDHTVVFSRGLCFPFTVDYSFKFMNWVWRIDPNYVFYPPTTWD